MAMANVYFLNAAPFPVEVLQLDEKGVENSHGLIQPGTRRMRRPRRPLRPPTAAKPSPSPLAKLYRA